MPLLPTPGGLPASPSIHDMPMPTPGVDPSQLRTFGDIPETRRLIYANTLEAAKAIPAVSNTRFSLAVENPDYDGPEEFSPEQEKRAVLENRTLSRRLQADYVMRDHTGKEIDRRRMTIAHVPHLTNLGTFVYHGNAYPLINQLRLRSGVFARVKDNGEIESHVNVAKGRAHRLSLDPETGVFRINIAQSHIPLMPLLQSLGATKKDVEDAWGPEIAAANYGKNDAKVMDKLYARILGPNAAPAADNLAKTAAVVKAYQEMTLDPEVTTRTLGKPFKNLSADVLLAATKKLIQLHRGEAAPDDRDAPAFQRILGPEDFFAEKFGLAGGVLRKALWKAAAHGSLAKAQPGGFTDLLNSVLTDSGLASAAEEVNPAELFDYQSRVTRMGKGGIPSETAIPAEARAVQPTYLGYIDPVRTPESSRTGVDLRFARAARKGPNGQVYTPVRDAKTGQLSYKSPQELAESVLGFPGHTDSDEPVPVIKGGRMDMVPKEEVTHYVPEFEDTFSPLGNLIPLKSMLKGQRAVMAARMMTQALPLQDAEAPFVRSATPEDANQSFEEIYSKHMGAVRAPQAARVVAVAPDKITLADKDGKRTDYPLYSRFPYNRKSVTGDTQIFIWNAVTGVRSLPIGVYEWSPGDLTLSVDPTTKQSAWLPVTGYVRHKNDKQLLRIETDSGRSVTVTEDHSLVTLGSDGHLCPIYPRDCKPKHTRLPLAMLPDVGQGSHSPYLEALGELVGLYLSEGHIPPVQPGAVYIAAAPTERKAEIMAMLSRLACRAYVNGGAVKFTDHAIAQYLVVHFGHLSHNKHLPDWVLTAPRYFREAVVRGYFAGDGCRWVDSNGAIQLSAVTVSAQLRDGLVSLLASLGIFATRWDAPRAHLHDTWRDGYGLRVISRHLAKLSRWFFYTDREIAFRAVLKNRFRHSSFELVPVVDKAARKLLYTGITKKTRRLYKTAHYGAVAKGDLLASDSVFRLWGESDVLWDEVVSITPAPHEEWVYDLSVAHAEVFAVCQGLIVHNTFLDQTPVVKAGDIVQPNQLLATSNFTDKDGALALGRNLRVGYIPYAGSNYEDAYIISESAAKKLTSHNMYQHAREWDDQSRQGKQTFTGIFPSKYDKDTLANFTDDGVIKPGTKVKFGDPLVLAVRERDMNKKSLLGGRTAFVDDSETWEHHSPGEVTDVAVTPKGVNVVVKASSPMQEADKIAGRMGDKGIIAKIIPDSDMPQDSQGRPFEVLANPLGIISRGNPNQIVEAALGKIAERTGKPYKLQDFKDAKEMVEFALEELRKHNMSDLEDVTDPRTGRKIPGVFTGNRWFMKLHHTADAKEQGRGIGSGYSAEGIPAKGGPQGSKRIGMLETSSLLSGGATKILRDARMIRGQARPEYWARYMAGDTPPVPTVSATHQKFMNMLRAAGINPVNEGTQTHLMAMTDKDIDALAGERNLENAETVDWADMAPIKGGLFDQKLTGGHASSKDGGNTWSAIKLHEPYPSPLMEEPIRKILGLTEPKFLAILSGKEDLNGKRGPAAIGDALDKIDVQQAIGQARADIASGKKTKRDAAIRRLGYLRDTERLGIHPRDWMLKRVPVLPPAFRPVSTMGAKKLPLVDDANFLYKEIFDANKNLADLSAVSDDVSEERAALYDAFKAVVGLGDPTHPKNQERQVKGILRHVFSHSPKSSIVHRKLLGSQVDRVGRATIAPDPSLDMDSVGLPANAAWAIYQPDVVRRLVRTGMAGQEAIRAVENRSPAARQALTEELEEGVVLYNRAPTLHRYGVMAAKPRLTTGHALKISPLVVGGFGADFDGDAMQFHVITDPDARKEALEKLLPSRNLFSVARLDRAHYLPSQEYVGGLYETSARIEKDKPPVTFATIKDALAARAAGEIGVGRRVRILYPDK